MTILFRTSLTAGAILLAAAIAAAQCQPHMPPQGAGASVGGATGGVGASNGAGPASPGPAGPSGPAPTSPHSPGNPDGKPASTGGPGLPPQTTQPVTDRRPGAPAGVRAGRTGARGAAMSFEHGSTALDRLKLDWKHPVPPERNGETTTAAGALPLEEAVALLWTEDDQRPLLVLRECWQCQGTDLPLLYTSANNDRTLLLSKWFRLVKLPSHVMDKNHPFHSLFAGFEFGETIPHFYLLAHPGAKPVAFPGDQTQASLWKGMSDMIEQRYLGDPAKAIKQWLAVLAQFDVLDATRARLTEELGAARAEQGPDSARAKQLQAKLDEAEQERKDLLEREKKVTDLKLKPFPKLAEAGDAKTAAK